MCIKYLAFFFTIAFSLVTKAQYTTTYKDFPSAAKQIPYSLISSGISKIGNLNLKELVGRIDQINVVERDWVETKVGENNRIFARWEVNEEGSTVYLNKRTWNVAFSEYNHVLALHEVLGTMGYDDHNYDISISMWILANEVESAQLNQEIQQNIIDEIKKLSKTNNGGVIGVGGGGDFGSLVVKLSILRHAYDRINMQKSVQAQNEFYTSYSVVRALRVEMKWKIKE